MATTTEIKQIKLAGTRKGIISIADVKEPYGTGTADVVSIGIALNGKDVEWKTHIPYENIDEVIATLTEAKNAK